MEKNYEDMRIPKMAARLPQKLGNFVKDRQIAFSVPPDFGFLLSFTLNIRSYLSFGALEPFNKNER